MQDSKDDFTSKKIWIGRKLRAVREDKEYAIGMLSILSSVKEETISRIENAEMMPSDTILKKIAMALCVPLSEFNPPEDLNK